MNFTREELLELRTAMFHYIRRLKERQKNYSTDESAYLDEVRRALAAAQSAQDKLTAP